MMISPPTIDIKQSEAPKQLSLTFLNLMNTYLDELIREEQLCYRAQLLLRRIAMPVCQLANGDKHIFSDLNHPAREIFETVSRIAKLSGDDFVPSDVLFKTMMESIKALRANKSSNMNTLLTVNADLKHVLKLATIRAPRQRRDSLKGSGAISDAKIIAALIVIQQSHSFPLNDNILYFALSDWLELLVVTILQCGRGAACVKKIERMTFMLFYLSSVKPEYQRKKVGLYFHDLLTELTQETDRECLGFPVAFDRVCAQARILTRARAD